MAKTFATLREEAETIYTLKGLTPNGLLPVGALQEGKDGLQMVLKDRKDRFHDAKLLDKDNEKMPKRPSNISTSVNNSRNRSSDLTRKSGTASPK